MHEPMDRRGTDDGEHCLTPQHVASERSSPVSRTREPVRSTMCFSAQCGREISMDCCGDPSTDEHDVELFRRATVQGDQDARAWVQQCLSEVVHDWLRCHPSREAACRLESEDHYVAQAFEHFWQATVQQKVVFRTLAGALAYLRASLNGAILDTLRAYTWPREVALPEPGEPQMEGSVDDSEVWDILKTMLSSPRERRLTYLFFRCGLKPREIVHFCPREWSDVQEIYRLRRDIMERLLRNADQLRWRLS
jgi:hypothetical protein